MESNEFPIGTKFKSGGKHPLICTVTDVWKTYNKAGELVKTRYVATHDFLGMPVTDQDVVAVAIARGLIEE